MSAQRSRSLDFAKTYKLSRGPVAPSNSKYERAANASYKALLDSIPTEKAMQAFLESHPSFVPGAWTPGTKSGHSPLHLALITQPQLRGLPSKVPDFMWIATHSLSWYPTLIEIEQPSKKLFTKNGQPTAAFTQARHQLEQWRTWFSSPANVQQFIEHYQIPDYMRTHRKMELHTILIYGRRREFEKDRVLSKTRAFITQPGFELISFDRLSCDKELGDAITVRLGPTGRYTAVAIPPTFSLGPAFADRLADTDGIPEAIDRCAGISTMRKAFLKQRLAYWKQWVKSGSRGGYNPADRE